jgi:hypothetical protein
MGLDLVTVVGLVAGLDARARPVAVMGLDLVAGLVVLARLARPVLVRHWILLVDTPFAPSARYPH